MSSLRMRCLEYIAKNGNFMPYQDIAAGLKENPQRVRGALGDASKEGYLSFGRDDITQQGGYSLTAKGKARIFNGHQTINGKQAGENKEASDAREAEAHVMNAPTMGNPIDESRFTSYNVLHKRIEGLEQDREKQRTLLASKIERIAVLEKEVAELQDCTADELVGTVEKLTQENAELRRDLEEAQRQLMKGATLANSSQMQRPIGWAHVWAEGFTRFDTEDDARKDIERSFIEANSVAVDESHLCAILNTAELSVKWARS